MTKKKVENHWPSSALLCAFAYTTNILNSCGLLKAVALSYLIFIGTVSSPSALMNLCKGEIYVYY